jgi:predicted porin
MKKALIGTTALVAGGLIAGSAVAADLIPAPAPEVVDDGFDATWSGYIRSGFYFGEGDECGGKLDPTGAVDRSCAVPAGAVFAASQEDTVVATNGELQLFVEQTLANGLRVGGEIDFGIAAPGGNVTVDELWVFFEGHYGQIRLGGKEGALDSLGGGSLPSSGAFNGSTDGPDMAPVTTISAGANGSIEDISGDANKITYLSPTLHGINLAVSYTPDPNQEFGTGRSFDANGGAARDQHVDEWSFAANATHTYGETTLHIAGGFTFADAEKNNSDLGDVSIWKIAGSIKHSYGGIGGWYSVREFDSIGANGNGPSNAAADKQTTTWGILANVVHGDYTIGGGYTHAEDEKFNTAAAGFTDDETEIWGLGISRSLGTGVEAGINATAMDDSPSSAAGTGSAASDVNASAWTAGAYLAISF